MNGFLYGQFPALLLIADCLLFAIVIIGLFELRKGFTIQFARSTEINGKGEQLVKQSSSDQTSESSDDRIN